MMYILLKAYQPGLFETTVPVKGHVTRTGTVVAPYQSIRRKRPTPPPTPDLFADNERPTTVERPKDERPTNVPEPAPEPQPVPEPEPEPDPYQGAFDLMELMKNDEGIAGGWTDEQTTQAYLHPLGYGTAPIVTDSNGIAMELGSKVYLTINSTRSKTASDLLEDVKNTGVSFLKDLGLFSGIHAFGGLEQAKDAVSARTSRPAIIVEMVIGPDAKTISIEKLKKEFEKEFSPNALYEEATDAEKRKKDLTPIYEKLRHLERAATFYEKDLTRYAALKGYDVIRMPEKGDQTPESIIINRKHLVINEDVRFHQAAVAVSDQAHAGAKKLGFTIEDAANLFSAPYNQGLFLKGKQHEIMGWLNANRLNSKKVVWNRSFKAALFPNDQVQALLAALEKPYSADQAYQDEVKKGKAFADALIPNFSQDMARANADLKAAKKSQDADDIDSAQAERDDLMGEFYKKLLNPPDLNEDRLAQRHDAIYDASDSNVQHQRTLFGALRNFTRMTGGYMPLMAFGVTSGTERANCSDDGSFIKMHPIETGRTYWTAFHEMGHSVEDGNPDVFRIAHLFFNNRVNSWKTQKLKDMTGNTQYGDNEIAYPGNVPNPYILKVYQNKHTEVISMGFQYLHNEEHALEFITGDPEYFYLMMSVIEDNRKRKL